MQNTFADRFNHKSEAIHLTRKHHWSLNTKTSDVLESLQHHLDQAKKADKSHAYDKELSHRFACSVELATITILIMDWAAAMGLPLGIIMEEKITADSLKSAPAK